MSAGLLNPRQDAYREQELQAMSTEQLVLVAYRVGLRALRKQDRRLATRVFSELINGLNFEAGDIAGKLLALYDYSLRLVREGKFAEAESILSELHDAWQQVVDASAGSKPAKP